MKKLFLAVAIVVALAGCSASDVDVQSQAQAFLDDYTEEYMELQYGWAKAEWQSRATRAARRLSRKPVTCWNTRTS